MAFHNNEKLEIAHKHVKLGIESVNQLDQFNIPPMIFGEPMWDLIK